MAYQIQYGQAGNPVVFYGNTDKRKSRFPWKLLLVIVLILCLYAFNTDAVRDAIIPGEKEITKAAFSELILDLKDGEPFVQAFSEFCEDIVRKDAFS